MIFLCAVLSIFLPLTSVSWAAEPDVTSTVGMTDPVALQEATRVLEEEIKLAARPQTYVFIDLASNVILIKGRGVELHRIPIESWSASHPDQMMASYRLRERPPVSRRKIDPAAGAEQEPISLVDMPTTYTLLFSSSLRILVFSNTEGDPWQWTMQRGRAWWRRLTVWGNMLRTGDPTLSPPSLDLTVSHEHAQSLAWTVVEGMPFLIRRSTP